MSRIPPITDEQAGLFQKVFFWFVRRSMRALTGKDSVPTPIRVTAHHRRLLRAYGNMELGQSAAKSVPAKLKALASIRAATLIGCPY